MTPKEIAEIKGLALQLAFELDNTQELDRLLEDAQVIYDYLIRS